MLLPTKPRPCRPRRWGPWPGWAARVRTGPWAGIASGARRTNVGSPMLARTGARAGFGVPNPGSART
eukprot:3893888-Lingulodinium_polyedra.AAC.1